MSLFPIPFFPHSHNGEASWGRNKEKEECVPHIHAILSSPHPVPGSALYNKGTFLLGLSIAGQVPGLTQGT